MLCCIFARAVVLRAVVLRAVVLRAVVLRAVVLRFARATDRHRGKTRVRRNVIT